MIGEKYEQSKKLQYILDNIQNCEIQFTNVEKNLLDQIEKIQINQKSSIPNIIYEIKKSNNQLQETVISQLKKAKRFFPPLMLLISDDQVKEEAIRIKNQLNRNLNVNISNLVDYFQQNYGYDQQIDLNGKQIVMFLSKEQDIKNKIFQTVKSPIILQNKWALINTPQFDMNSEVEYKNEMINEFQQIFKKYKNQISLFFLIIDQERNDIVKQNFVDLFSQLKKFKQKIIVLLYNRFEENFEENSNLNNYFIKIAKTRKVYTLSNSQLLNQQSINEYFNKILEEQQDDLEIGIDMKDTIFDIRDERQSEIEQHTFEQDFYKSKVQQLKQSVDQDDQQIILYQQKIEEFERQKKELEKSKQQKLNEIRDIERDVSQKQKIIKNIQKETQIISQNSGDQKILQQQSLQITPQNQAISDIKDSQIIKSRIQNLEREKLLINQQLQECYSKQENIQQKQNQNNYGKKQQEQQLQLLSQQLEVIWKKIEENDKKTREYNNQLEQLQIDNQKDDQKFNQTNYVYYSRNTASVQQTYKNSYGYQGSAWS